MIKKSQLYLLFGFIAFIVILSLAAIFQGTNNVNQGLPSPSPRPRSSLIPLSNNLPAEIKPILSNEVPLKPESQGGGVNLESSLVQTSEEEIKKILPLLPYQNNLTATSGKEISILIPAPQFQTTPWVLDVQIYGINYQVSETDADYNLQKESFIAAASNIFDWIKSRGVDPKKIIINWGDKSYIRESAEKWLTE